MKIGIDVDGCLADFNTDYIAHIVKTTGVDLFPPRPFDIPTWDYPAYYGYTKEQTAKAWGLVLEHELFWYSLVPYPGVIETLERLSRLRHQGHDIYFITNRPGNRSKRQTESWLQSFGYLGPTVLISADKAGCAHVLSLDAYVDDKWENAVGVERLGYVNTFLVDRPWNTKYHELQNTQISRVSSVGVMLNKLKFPA